MKRFIPILMMLLLLTGCGAQSSETTYRQISMEEAVTMMEEETEYIILDVRTAGGIYVEKALISRFRLIIGPKPKSIQATESGHSGSMPD